MLYKKPVLFLLLFFCIGLSAQQPFTSINYFQDKGLTANDIYGVTEDVYGQIWIGSNNGIYKFNGNVFERFGYTDSLKSRIYTRIYALKDSSIIVIGEEPNAVYSIKDEKVTILTKGVENLKIVGKRTLALDYEVLCITQWGNNLLRINSESIKQEKNDFTSFDVEKLFAFNSRHFIYKKKDKKSIIEKKKSIQHFLNSGEESPELKTFTKDHEGNCIAITKTHIYKITSSGEITNLGEHNINPSTIDIYHAAIDRENRIWIAGINNGIFMYNIATKTTENVSESLKLSNCQINYLFCDSKDNIWISTAGKGLFCILNTEFSIIPINTTLTSSYITCMALSKTGDLWAGTNSGIFNIRPKLYENETMSFTNEQLSGSGYIHSIYVSPENHVFLGGVKSIYFTKTLHQERFRLKKDATVIHRSNDSIMTFGSWARVLKWKILADEYISSKLEHRKSFVYKLKSSKTLDILYYQGKELILTNNELWYWNSDSTNFNLYEVALPQEIEQKKDHDYYLYDLLVDKKDVLWLATSLGIFKKQGSTWQKYSKDDGLISNLCRKMTVDSQNNIWVATDEGLNVLIDNQFITYTKSNGLPSNQINTILYDSIYNLLWVGTSNGLSYLDMFEWNKIPNEAPKVEIKSLEVIGDTLIKYPNELVLNSDQNNIKIEFSIAGFKRASQFFFQFKMLNSESGWQLTNGNSINYPALAPGNYTFLVRCKITGSSWSEASLLNFTIKVPIWKRWDIWFGVSSLALIIALVFFNRRLIQLKKKEAQKRKIATKMNKLEQQALLASMNPHFIYNSLNSIQHFLSKHKDPQAIDFVAEFGQLVRQNMEFSGRRNIDLQEEIDYLKRYLKLESLRFNNKLEYKISHDPQLSGKPIPIPAMLIQPFVENALWHGLDTSKRDGKVDVYFAKKDKNTIKITIKDNGIGFYAKSKSSLTLPKDDHTSMGIKLIENRIKLLSPNNSLKIEEIKDSNDIVSGTKVTVILEIKIQKKEAPPVEPEEA